MMFQSLWESSRRMKAEELWSFLPSVVACKLLFFLFPLPKSQRQHLYRKSRTESLTLPALGRVVTGTACFLTREV